MLKGYIRRENHPPLIYLYSDIECAVVSDRWISPIPVKNKIKSK